MKKNKDEEIKLRCTPEDKQRLASISEATGQSESEVVRQLITLGYQKTATAVVAKHLLGEKGKVDLTLTFGDDDPQNFLNSIKLISSILLEHDKRDTLDTVLEAVWNPETRGDTLARAKRIFAYDFAADQGINNGD
jgi:hypothetical protein